MEENCGLRIAELFGNDRSAIRGRFSKLNFAIRNVAARRSPFTVWRSPFGVWRSAFGGTVRTSVTLMGQDTASLFLFKTGRLAPRACAFRTLWQAPKRLTYLQETPLRRNVSPAAPLTTNNRQLTGTAFRRHPSPAARAIRNNPVPRTMAPMARATRSPAGARRSTVMAAVTTPITRKSMTPMARRIAVRPAQQ
jgi:hypothetical protein